MATTLSEEVDDPTPAVGAGDAGEALLLGLGLGVVESTPGERDSEDVSGGAVADSE